MDPPPSLILRLGDVVSTAEFHNSSLELVAALCNDIGNRQPPQVVAQVRTARLRRAEGQGGSGLG